MRGPRKPSEPTIRIKFLSFFTFHDFSTFRRDFSKVREKFRAKPSPNAIS